MVSIKNARELRSGAFRKAAVWLKNVIKISLVLRFISYILRENFLFQAFLFTAYIDKSDLRRNDVPAMVALERMELQISFNSRYEARTELTNWYEPITITCFNRF